MRVADLRTWWSNFAGSGSSEQLFRIVVAIDADSVGFKHLLVGYSLWFVNDGRSNLGVS